MYRSNPQLGRYCCIKKANIVKVNKKSYTVSDGYTNRLFTFCGDEVKHTESVYGYTYYRIWAQELVPDLFDGEKFDGYRVSSGIKLLKECVSSK